MLLLDLQPGFEQCAMPEVQQSDVLALVVEKTKKSVED
jgi:hypothetical protein